MSEITEAGLREALAVLDCGLARFDRDGRIVDTAGAAPLQLEAGFSLPEAVGDDVWAGIRTALDEGNVVAGVDVVGAEGRSIRLRLAPIEDGAGEFYGVSRPVLGPLPRSAAYYRQLFDATREAIVVFEPNREIVLEVNQRACEMYGLTRDEFVGRSFEDMSENVERGKEAIRETLDRGFHLVFDSTHYRADGSSLRVEVQLTRIEHDGSTALLSVHRDVTDRRRVDQHDRLAAIGELAAGIGHDLNNVLQTILVSTSVALQPESDTAETLGAIADEARRGAQLIRQILDFTRRTVVDPRPLDLSELASDAAAMLIRAIPESIRTRVDVQGGTWVRGDPAQLRQVLTNLVVNARDAMPLGGAMEILVRSEDSGADRRVVLAVSDTGTGIDPVIRDRIFEPFTTTKPPTRGSGLGLSQVYGIVQQHGGTIEFESAPSEGTTFRVRFPGIERPVARREISGPHPTVGGERTLLLVEDDAVLAKMLAQSLTQARFDVVVAHDGREALERVASGLTPELVLTDVVMPEMGGRELCLQLRARGYTAPIVIMSGYPLHEDMKDVLDLPGVAWLAKPFTTHDLAAVLAELDLD